MAPAAMMRTQVYVPTLRFQKLQIASRRFGARNNDKGCICRDRLTSPKNTDLQIWIVAQRIKVIKVCDPRQPEADDMGFSRPQWRGNVERVFGGEFPRLRKIGQNAKTLPSGAGFHHTISIVKKAHIATELVDDKPPYHRFVCWIKNGLCTHQLCDHTATINIAHKHHGHICRTRKTHIRDIALSQVHFGRASRPFDQHDINTVLKALETF